MSLSKLPGGFEDKAPAADDGKAMGVNAVRRGLLFFWAAWTGIVVITNLTDAVKTLAILPDSWPLASGNYALLVKVTAIYQTPSWLTALFFCGVILWEAAATILYCRAALNHKRGAGTEMPEVAQEFGVSLGLWMAFMIADEALVAYRIENTHRSIFMAQLLTLLAIWLLRDGRSRP